MAESTNQFKKQQEMCHSTSTVNSTALAVNSSDARKGLQNNNKGIVLLGEEFDRLTKFLLETRQAFTTEQLKEAGYIDMSANKVLIDTFLEDPQIYYDGKHFSYKPKHDLKDKIQLLDFIRKFPKGIAIDELMDAYPSVGEDLQALEAAGQIWVLKNMKYRDATAFPSDPRLLPRDVIDPKTKDRLHPRLVIIKPRQKMTRTMLRTMVQSSKLTNGHLSYLFETLGL